MILVHFRNGTTKKFDPRVESDISALDPPDIQQNIRRVAIVDGNGHRVDLPSFKGKNIRTWMELVCNGDEVRGERVCIRHNGTILKVTFYYSDGRVVLDMR